MAKKDPFQEIMSNIDWTQWMQVLIPVLQPIIIFGAWLGLSKIDNRADLVSKIIAIAEPIPTLDLNVPRPVVLASIYHSVDETLDILEALMDILEDIPGMASDKVQKLKEEILTPLAGEGITDEAKFLSDFADCKKNAKVTLGIFYNKYTAWPWITSCLVAKGYGRKIIEERVRQALGI